jgi:glycine/D-amino acid oxidase-like deaminating enzyme
LQAEYRDLRTRRTVWEADGLPFLPRQALERSIETDVIIVGAGISGALTADSLTEAGMRVVIVDRRGAVRGSTVATTALVLFEIDTPLVDLARHLGWARAERAWKRSARAVVDLANRIETLRISCAWQWRDALYLLGDRTEPNDLAKEAEARQRIGLPSRLIDRDMLRCHYDIDRRLAIRSHTCGEIDPVRLASNLIGRALRRGARLFAPVEITSVDTSPRGVLARTKTGLRIAASSLIYATGYEVARRVPCRGHRVISTWALATKRQPDRLWPSRCLIWETGRPYLYIRTTRDGRVIAGGADEDINDERNRDALIATKTKVIQKKLHGVLPNVDVTAAYAWAGSFGESGTGLPTIGPIPTMPNCYAILGFGGNGITWGMIAAQVLTGHICGPCDPDADLFSFEAKPAVRRRRQA